MSEQQSDLTAEEKAKLLMERLATSMNAIPFNAHIGLEVSEITGDYVKARFPMKPHLIGNMAHQILHGGVIATALDAIGGAAGISGAYQKMKGLPREEKLMRMAKFGTIDMRVDYLQPGRGEWFEVTGYVVRVGKKVCVTRMELSNHEGELIAMGTGTYLY